MSYTDPYLIDESELNFFNNTVMPNIKDENSNLVDGNISLDCGNITLKHGSINLDHGGITLNDGSINLSDGSINLDNQHINLQSGDINLRKGQLFIQSDKRLKTDIRPIENALDRIETLKGVYYHWKDDDKKEKGEIGVIAQDVQQQFPELVNTDKNGILSVDYAKLTAILIECVKDLKQQISYLKKHS